MRLLRKQSALWCIVLIFGVAAIAIPVAARVSSTVTTFITERQTDFYHQAGVDSEYAGPNDRSNEGLAVGLDPERPQIRYDRRRQYLEDRVERRLDRRQEYLDRQTGGGDDDDEDSDDRADSRADDGGDDDEDDPMDPQEEIIERRREYLRDRAERRW